MSTGAYTSGLVDRAAEEVRERTADRGLAATLLLLAIVTATWTARTAAAAARTWRPVGD